MITNKKSNKDKIEETVAHLHFIYTMQYWSDFVFIFAFSGPLGRNSIILITPEIHRFYNRS